MLQLVVFSALFSPNKINNKDCQHSVAGHKENLCSRCVSSSLNGDLITTWTGPAASPQGASQSLPHEGCRHSNHAINGKKIKAP